MVTNTDLGPVFEELPGLKELVPKDFGGLNKLTYDEISGRLFYPA